MPRKDRTFSSTDILRIHGRNLTSEEAREVVDALCVVEPGKKKAPPRPRVELQTLVKNLRTLINAAEVAVIALDFLALLPGPQRLLLSRAALVLTGAVIPVKLALPSLIEPKF